MPLLFTELPRAVIPGKWASGERGSRKLTASVITIDSIASGKHIGASQLIEAGTQHLYETTADACSIYRFNNYEYRCRDKRGARVLK